MQGSGLTKTCYVQEIKIDLYREVKSEGRKIRLKWSAEWKPGKPSYG